MNQRATRLLGFLAAGAALSSLVPSAAAQCVTGGGNGFCPGPNAVDGVWPTQLPTGELVAPLSVTVPGGATVINKITFRMKHNWIGDLQMVLESPSGVRYNLYQSNDGVFGGGCFSDFYGQYDLVDSLGGNPCAGGGGPVGCGGNSIAPGTYWQEWGAWPSGSSSIVNVPLEQIPIASGTWNMILYDWYVIVDHGALLDWEMCFGQPTPPPPPPPPQYPVNFTCVAGGAGSLYPPFGSIEGVWPSTLPTGEMSSAASIAVPAGATKVVMVRMLGWQHTWVTDSMVVLEDPTGSDHLIYQGDNGSFCGGCVEDLGGDYEFVDAIIGAGGFCSGGSDPFPSCTTGALIPPARYVQDFGAWPSGSAGVNNTLIESIPISSGTWTMKIYDWCINFDNGGLTSWELCFDAIAAPTPYCAAQAPGTTNGCLPTIAATGNPNVAQNNNCVITVSTVEGNKSGILFYGVSGPQNTTWCSVGGNSFLCAKAPNQRTVGQNSGGATGSCNGSLTLNWNAYHNANPGSLGSPFAAGQHAYVQGWFRDPPSCKTTFLSQALDMTYVP